MEIPNDKLLDIVKVLTDLQVKFEGNADELSESSANYNDIGQYDMAELKEDSAQEYRQDASNLDKIIHILTPK